MTISTALSRYYGFDVPAAVDDVRDERLTDVDADDLFAAHMKANYGYFGALDKTLSGFVVLDNDGDDAYLLDVRDTGAVFFQDHEEREVNIAFASLADYAAWRTARSTSDDRAAVDEKLKTTVVPPSKRALSSVALLRRLQWAVWFFAQPTRDLGTDNVNRETRIGCNLFHEYVGDDIDARFEREVGGFRDDVPLATSWLLAAAALGDTKRLQQIVQAGPAGVPLFDAFAAALLPLSTHDTLEVLPVFAQRKSQLCFQHAMERNDDQSLAFFARAVVAAPEVQPLYRGRLITFLTEKLGTAAAGVATAEALAAAGHMPGKVARLVFDAAHGTGGQHPEDVGPVAALIVDSTESAAERAWHVTTLGAILSPRERLAAARAILALDAFHFGMLAVVVEASEALGAPDLDAKQLRDELAQIRPLYNSALKGADAAAIDAAIAGLSSLSPALRLLMARRVLAAVATFERRFVEVQLQWSASHPWPGRGAVWRDALGLIGGGVDAVVAGWQTVMPVPDEVTGADIAVVLAGPIPAGGPPIIQEGLRRDITKALTAWLAKRGS